MSEEDQIKLLRELADNGHGAGLRCLIIVDGQHVLGLPDGRCLAVRLAVLDPQLPLASPNSVPET